MTISSTEQEAKKVSIAVDRNPLVRHLKNGLSQATFLVH